MIERNEELKKIGQRLIRQEFEELKLAKARVAFLASDVEKKKNKKTVFADCRKVADQYAWCCRYDFMITVYMPNVAAFSDEQMEILLRHELMHCGVDYTDSGVSFYIVPHDIEEFYSIIEKHGMNWSEV